jgi:hypothetical protein
MLGETLTLKDGRWSIALVGFTVKSALDSTDLYGLL